LPFCHVTLRGQRRAGRAYPVNVRTVGDQIRKVRMEARLTQKEAAAKIGVEVSTLRQWEWNRHSPSVRQLPSVTAFLGYVPFPPGESLPERLTSYRRALGLSRPGLAARLNVDVTTVWRWESGRSEPSSDHHSSLARLSAEQRKNRPGHARAATRPTLLGQRLSLRITGEAEAAQNERPPPLRCNGLSNHS
jgi:DNA-binding transcriptional regulator YiaG